MNILFLTLLDYASLEERNIYTDLLREFQRNGNKVYCISPIERRKNQKTYVIREDKVVIVKLRIGNTQKTGFIEKGISTITIEPLFILGIKKYFSKVKFDLVIYSTPPITFCNVVYYVKKRDHARTYLLLKDIWPQGIIDLDVLSKNGFNGIFYKYLLKKEKQLYKISDKIGCMSQANMEYILKHNPDISVHSVEICPNSIEVIDKSVDDNAKNKLRHMYGMPLDKMIFVYGGNLGKPQGVDFIIRCIHSQRKNDGVFFLIIGDGTEYRKLEYYKQKYRPINLKLMRYLPKKDYEKIMGACDVGMLFLDHRFTIPNFPSRLLDYMAAKLPVLACTDPNTDVGKVIVEGGFGWWCESDDLQAFCDIINTIEINEEMKRNSFNYICNNFSVNRAYNTIMESGHNE